MPAHLAHVLDEFFFSVPRENFWEFLHDLWVNGISSVSWKDFVDYFELIFFIAPPISLVVTFLQLLGFVGTLFLILHFISGLVRRKWSAVLALPTALFIAAAITVGSVWRFTVIVSEHEVPPPPPQQMQQPPPFVPPSDVAEPPPPPPPQLQQPPPFVPPPEINTETSKPAPTAIIQATGLRPLIPMMHKVWFDGRDNLGTSLVPRFAANRRTRLTYQIGPREIKKAINQQPVSSKLQAVLAQGDAAIEVQFLCGVCSWTDNFQPRQTIEWDKDRQRSEPAEFYFTPVLKGQDKGVTPSGQRPGVSIILWINDIRYDEVHICVNVGKTGDHCGKDVASRPGKLLASPLPGDVSQHYGDADSPKGVGYKFESLNEGADLRTDVAVELSEPRDSRQHLTIHLKVYGDALLARVADWLEQHHNVKLANRIRKREAATFLELSQPTEFRSLKHFSESIRHTYFKLMCLVSTGIDFQSWVASNQSTINLPDCANMGHMAKLSNWGDEGFDVTEAEQATQVLSATGQGLYTWLFQGRNGGDTNSDLALVMRAVVALARERVAKPGVAPLRFRFTSGEVHMPAQLLQMPPAQGTSTNSTVFGVSPDPDGFFGLIFDLAVDKIGGTDRPSAPRGDEWYQPLGARTNWEPIFGLFTDGQPVTASTDCTKLVGDVAQTACTHYHHVVETLKANGKGRGTGPDIFGNSFMASMAGTSTTSSDSIPAKEKTSLVWYYGHAATHLDSAQSGDNISANYYLPTPDAIPRLIFFSPIDPSSDAYKALSPAEQRRQDRLRLGHLSGDFEVNAKRIDDLANDFDRPDPVFGQAPIVVLIACESGAWSAGGTSTLTLARAFLHLGARGVIATEAEIDSGQANRLGDAVLSQLFNDKDGPVGGSLALLRARRQIYASGHNLWPLLFYYAGAPGAVPEQ